MYIHIHLKKKKNVEVVQYLNFLTERHVNVSLIMNNDTPRRHFAGSVASQYTDGLQVIQLFHCYWAFRRFLIFHHREHEYPYG